MCRCEVKKTITLTVEPGSHVILSAAQYKAVKDYVSTLDPAAHGKEDYNSMPKGELMKVASEKGVELPDKVTKAQILELLVK